MLRICVIQTGRQSHLCTPVRRFSQAGTRWAPLVSQAVMFKDYGKPSEVLSVVSRPIEPLTPSTVHVRILAAPVNPSDINQIEGVYPAKPTFDPKWGAVAGNEGVAQIVALGEAVQRTSDLEVGDWVLPLNRAFGTWQTYASVEASDLAKIPHDQVPLLGAASLTVNPSTAYRMLRDFVDLNPGRYIPVTTTPLTRDYVIQSGANSGVGQAVIQLCRCWGFKSINIIRDRPTAADTMAQLKALGADYVFTDEQLRTIETRNQLKSLDGPIALGLDCVGGRTTMELGRNLSSSASLVVYGGMSKRPMSLPVSLFIFRNLAVQGYWMNHWYRTHSLADRMPMWTDLLKLMQLGQLRPAAFEPLLWVPSGDRMDAVQQLRTVIEAIQASSAGFAGKKHALVMDPSLL
ncbi:mitochondrial 2-enoyl thioester reductase [Dimargaris verticillata]|uniref:enoyl-[acyl-carrier-protein] reductase n=1 Tax=Dimargaris verticillata TaxID=2761393 RepID=A0A9W8ED96_9FUNG|nr:mitochondrial 2-enoyl thioester reductase [Dimargaris verticillata]